MSDPEGSQRFLRAWDAHRAMRRGEEDPTREEPEEVRAAIEMGDFIAGSDFSGDSRIRESLKERLLSSPQLATPRERASLWPHKLFLGAGWATLALVLVAALAWSIQNLVPGALTNPPEAASLAATQELILENSAPAPEEPFTAQETVSVDAPQAIILTTPTPLPNELAEFTVIGDLLPFSEIGSQGRLAYIASGAVWSASVPGAHARQLTEEGDFSQPRWSATGNWLAYREGETRLWLVSNLGRGYILEVPEKLDDFAWAPEGDRLAYTTGADLRVAAFDGASLSVQSLSVPEGVGQLRRPAWSPDGKRLAFDTLGPAGVWTIPAVSGEGAALLYDGEASLRGWTGDGAYLVIWQGVEGGETDPVDGTPLALVPSSGGEPVVVRNSVLLHTDSVALTGSGLGWLALASGGGRETWTNKGLSLLGPVVESSLAPDGVSVSTPSWSPDYGRLAFAAMPEAGHVWGGPAAVEALMERHLWTVSISNGKLIQLTDENAFRDEYPMWSNNGEFLLFVRMDQQGNASVWQIGAQGGDPFMLVYGLTPADLGMDVLGDFGHIPWGDLIDWQQ